MKFRELSKEEYVVAQERFCLHPLQSWAWGEVKKDGWTPLRLGLFENGTLVYPLMILKKSIPGVHSSFGYIPRMFISSEDMVTALVRIGRKNSLSHIVLDPDTAFGKLGMREKIKSILINAQFIENKLQIQPNRTIFIDLMKSEEELLSAMRTKHRQYIRKATRDGITIRVGNESDLDTFCKIIHEIAQTKKYIFHGSDYYKKVWNEFSKSQSVQLIVAEFKKEIVGAYMVVHSSQGTYELYGGVNEKGNVLRASFPMKWESIRNAKRLGKKFYDQWGAEEWYPGLVTFKEGFGGEVITFPSQFIYVYKKTGYLVYKTLLFFNSLRQKIG